MIPEYNRIDFENDDISVIEAKIEAIKKGVAEGTVTAEEMEVEKKKLNEAIGKYSEKVGYSFTWWNLKNWWFP